MVQRFRLTPELGTLYLQVEGIEPVVDTAVTK